MLDEAKNVKRREDINGELHKHHTLFMMEAEGPFALCQELDKKGFESTLDELVVVCRDRTTNLDQKSSRSILIRSREAIAEEVFALNGRDGPDAHAASRSSRSLSNFQLVSRGARGRKVEATNALLRYDLARLAYCKAGRLSFQDVSTAVKRCTIADI